MPASLRFTGKLVIVVFIVLATVAAIIYGAWIGAIN